MTSYCQDRCPIPVGGMEICTPGNFRIIKDRCLPILPSLKGKVYLLSISSLYVGCVGGRYVVFLVHRSLDQEELHLDLMLVTKSWT